MDGDVTLASANAQDMFTAALNFGADPSYTTTRTSDTVTTDAVAGSVAIDNSKSTGWQSFFQDTAKALVGYSLAKDAQHSGVVQPGAATTAQQASQTASSNQRMLLLIAVAIGGAFLVLHTKQ